MKIEQIQQNGENLIVLRFFCEGQRRAILKNLDNLLDLSSFEENSEQYKSFSKSFAETKNVVSSILNRCRHNENFDNHDEISTIIRSEEIPALLYALFYIVDWSIGLSVVSRSSYKELLSDYIKITGGYADLAKKFISNPDTTKTINENE